MTNQELVLSEELYAKLMEEHNQMLKEIIVEDVGPEKQEVRVLFRRANEGEYHNFRRATWGVDRNWDVTYKAMKNLCLQVVVFPEQAVFNEIIKQRVATVEVMAGCVVSEFGHEQVKIVEKPLAT